MLVLLFSSLTTFAQSNVTQDSFRAKRFWAAASAGTVIYGATVVGLNEAWYKDHERTSFHFFDDWGEWEHMDKVGHTFTAYFEAELCYRAALWTGMRRKSAVWAAAGTSLLLQSTVEVLDGFSSKWGFSWYDMAFNIAGTASFAAQEFAWHEQRFRFKISATKRNYSTKPVSSLDGFRQSSLASRADQLFGRTFAERYLKDYNAQTIWISFNPQALWKLPRWPTWLNMAVGYGSENLYGGYENSWIEGESLFVLDEDQYPRYSQWYLSPDLDLTRIKTNSKFLKTAFRILNVFKMPAPALEYSKQRGLRLHWLHL